MSSSTELRIEMRSRAEAHKAERLIAGTRFVNASSIQYLATTQGLMRRRSGQEVTLPKRAYI